MCLTIKKNIAAIKLLLNYCWHPIQSQWKRALVFACILLQANYSYSTQTLALALYDLSLEDLGNIQVTLVSKKNERVVDAGASIYVITEDAIRRSGARSLPEALRLAPNLQVAQLRANQYAISARGFNAATANKLLVMIDGRTVYTPLYSGVFWDAQDVMLQDVAQIEIVSGAGGTLWGANAVNGVINIITKEASDTHGNLMHVSSSNKERGLAMRHGGSFADNRGGYRVYGKINQWAHSVRASGIAEPDAWTRSQAGFRSDWSDEYNDIKLLGNTYRNAIDQLLPEQETNSGTNLLLRWKRKLSDGSSLRIRSYIDHSTHNTPGVYSEKLDIVDIELQHLLRETPFNQLIWGGGYRVANDRVGNSDMLAFLPANRLLHWANLFVQQEHRLSPEWRLTLGGRVETNDYTGSEFLPSVKLTWKLADNKLLWTSLARAVRAPSRIDSEIYAPGKPPYLLAGSSDFRSEIAHTLELGWRAQAGEFFSYSLVAYQSDYDHLRSVDTLPSGVLVFGNQLEGKTSGLEALVNYQITRSWQVEASGFTVQQDFNGSNLSRAIQGNDPHSQWALRSKWALNKSQQLGLSLRHVGKLSAPVVPDYTSLDAHFSWSPSPATLLSVTGRNLNDPRHQEFASGTAMQQLNPIQIEREVDLAITVQF